MQARFYLPWVGRFGSPDPARDQHFEQTQSWNIYSYVRNDPTMSIDPTGMVDWKAWENRGMGALKVVGALAEGAAGAALIGGTSGAGAIPGVMVLAHASDVGGAGLRQMLSGKEEQTLTSQGIQKGLEASGMKTETAHATAETTDQLISVANTLMGVQKVLGLGGSGSAAAKQTARELTKEETKSVQSLEKRIAEHEQKLAEFKQNPTVRPGMEGLSQEKIAAQQARRIEHLETEIKTFRNNIDKIKNGAK
jgi:uncharacterized protein RhaS with RHS repeats